ncbi:hypothetical protein RclHR1_23510005 [Rhizophagus clarus]|uniref:Uncharacterized protein n=1 Tax=Rhizophagus clarus TaxID=94130 RepID=A0A2Z6QXY1_9GLOM|nr:hypothetical protein RclHR1_23510005 [Rhizophagus clarus]
MNESEPTINHWQGVQDIIKNVRTFIIRKRSNLIIKNLHVALRINPIFVENSQLLIDTLRSDDWDLLRNAISKSHSPCIRIAYSHPVNAKRINSIDNRYGPDFLWA